MKMKQSFNFKPCRVPVACIASSEKGVEKIEKGYGLGENAFGIIVDGAGGHFAGPCSFEMIF